MRRWQVVVLAVLGVFALACEGTGVASPGPSSSTKPKAGLPASMAALGDSITAGFGSCATLLACGRNSWSTGTASAVDSHYLRIKDGNSKISGHEHNFSVPGAQAEAMAGQAKEAVNAKVDYVTMLIGANDACTAQVDWMTPENTFRSQIDAALAVLKKGLPRARVLIVSIPDLYRLWELGHTDASAVRAWNFGICPSLLGDPTATDKDATARRREVRDRIDAYDKELGAACKAYGKNCRYDNGAVHSVQFSLSLVNHLDYFHPNANGQKELAAVSYPGTFTW